MHLILDSTVETTATVLDRMPTMQKCKNAQSKQSCHYSNASRSYLPILTSWSARWSTPATTEVAAEVSARRTSTSGRAPTLYFTTVFTTLFTLKHKKLSIDYVSFLKMIKIRM